MRQIPDATLAAHLAEATAGRAPRAVNRFPTGSQHYVFEATFDDRAPLVVRIADDSGRQAMAGALELSRQLRPLGVPLPEILAEGLDDRFAWIAMERLEGRDLGQVIATLSPDALADIATGVASAQATVAATGASGRYGYAVRAAEAPHERWSAVVADNVARSRRRIAAAGLFDLQPVERLEVLLAQSAPALDEQPAVPFMHDTTTKNVIVTADGRLSGIVDVDDLCFGDPCYVVALTHAAIIAFGGSTDYVAAWRERAGFAADRLYRLYVAVFLVDFMAEHGGTFNGNMRPSKREERERLLGLFGRWVENLD